MNHNTCTACGHQIDNGQAVIRSIDFERVAFHGDCFTAWRALQPVPVQRIPESKPTLSERLAAGRAS